MRIVKLVCDRCGKEIKGNSVMIDFSFIDREADDLATQKVPGIDNQSEKDYCIECVAETLEFLNSKKTEGR